MKSKVAIIGGGFSGLAAAYLLAKEKIPVVVLEKENFLGGVAATTVLADGRQIPSGYHHILSTDASLIATIDRLGLSTRINWQRISLVANIDGERVNLSSPLDILKLKRLPFFSRLRYCLFGARCLFKSDWQEWEGKSIEELIKKLTDEFILKEIFAPLVDIKFGLQPRQVDAAWLGQRLHNREAACNFGYIPKASWPAEICDAFRKEIENEGGEVVMNTELERIAVDKNKITKVITSRGKEIRTMAVLSTVPPPIIASIIKKSKIYSQVIPELDRVKYISSYSLIAGVPSKTFPDYWTIALHPRKIFGACFNLSVLNNTLLNNYDKSVINLFTNIPFNNFKYTDREYVSMAEKELGELTGRKVKFNWAVVNRLKYSSPIFDINYQKPRPKLSENLFLAGIYEAFPKLASTGSAIRTGEEAARGVIKYLK